MNDPPSKQDMTKLTRGLVFPLMVLVIGATACAQRPTTGPGAGGTPPPTGRNSLVLRVEAAGGLLAPAAALTQVPEFSLFGDGRVITAGPQIEIYPGPALPNLRVTTISQDAIQVILQAARAAGLFGPDRHYLSAVVADAPTTTFTLVAAGVRHVISANALGVDTGHPSGQMSEQERLARVALQAFRAKLSNLATWLPKGSIGQDRVYVPTGLRVFAQAGAPDQQPGLREPVINWPLAVPLASFGSPLPTAPGLRCGAIAGTDLAKLLPVAGRANQLSPWRSGGATYSVTFRPLLPDESGCPR